jgi:hypothetical protein
MKENGRMIKLMAMVNICTWMVLVMRDIGKKINSMVSGEKFGLMAQHLKVNMLMVRNMVKVHLLGLIVVSIQVNSLITIFMAKEFTNGLTKDFMRVNGLIIK